MATQGDLGAVADALTDYRDAVRGVCALEEAVQAISEAEGITPAVLARCESELAQGRSREFAARRAVLAAVHRLTAVFRG